MAGAIYNIHIEQGAIWNITVKWLNSERELIDLSLYKLSMTIRNTYGGTVLASLTEDNGRIANNGTSGAVLWLNAVDTAAMTSGGVYTLEACLLSGGVPDIYQVWRLLSGIVVLHEEANT